MSTSTAAAPRRAAKSAKLRAAAASPAKKARDAARRREIERIVRPMVRRLVAQEIEDQLDVAASEAALAEGGESIPLEVVLKRLGW